MKAAIGEAKLGKDIQNYERAVSALQQVAPGDSGATLDHAWVDKVKKQVKAETDKMELELKGYKNNLIKESIRVHTQSPPYSSQRLTSPATDGI